MEDLVDGLRRVADLLPPNFTVNANEAPALLGAMIQYAEHGDDLVKAAEAGPQAVADFYHGVISDQAEALGVEPPRKGAPVEKVSVASGAPVTASGAPATAADVARLTALVQQLAASVNAKQPQPEVTVTTADQAGQDSQAEAGV